MQLKEIMTPHVESIDAATPITEVAQKMKELDVGALPVTLEKGVFGIVTDRDIAIRAVAEQLDPAKTAIGDIATREALAMKADTQVSEAVEQMERKQVRRLLVTNDAGDQMVGIVSLGDIAVRAGEEIGGEALQKISDPTQPDRRSPVNV